MTHHTASNENEGNLNTQRNISIPETLTPESVYLIILFIHVAVYVPASYFLGEIAGLIAPGILLVFSLYFKMIYVNIYDFKAAILFNPMNKKRRAVFAGLHPKLWWESLEKKDSKEIEGERVVDYTDLRKFLLVEPTKNWATIDPAKKMTVKFVLSMWVNINGKAEEAAANFILFRSFPAGSIERKGDALITKIYSSHYSKKQVQNLIVEIDVTNDVMGRTDSEKNPDNPNQKLHTAFEIEHGIGMDMILEDSGPDKETTKLMTPKSRATASMEAMGVFTADVPGKLSSDEALKMVKLQDEDGEYSEKKFTIDVTGLENLEHLNAVIGGGGGDSKKHGKKDDKHH